MKQQDASPPWPLPAARSALRLRRRCSSDSYSGSSSSTGSGSAPKGGTINGAGATFPAPVYSEWAARFKDKQGTTVNYQADRLGRRHRAVHRRHRRLRRDRLGDEGRGDRGRQEEGRSGPHPDGARRGHRLLQRQRRRQGPQARRRDGRRHLPRQDHELERQGDRGAEQRRRRSRARRSPSATARTSRARRRTSPQFLADYSKAWEKGPGVDKSVKWPTGTGAKGNDGVAACVKQTDGAVGYVEQAYALQNNFTTAAVKNKEGNFVEPTLAGHLGRRRSRQAAGGSALQHDRRAGRGHVPDRRGHVPARLPGRLQGGPRRDARPALLKDWLNYALGDGQAVAPELQYAPLPDAIKTIGPGQGRRPAVQRRSDRGLIGRCMAAVTTPARGALAPRVGAPLRGPAAAGRARRRSRRACS